MAQIPRGYKINTNKELQELYEKVCNKCIEIGMFDYIPKLYLFNSVKMWGWARYSRTISALTDGCGWYYCKYHYTEHAKPIVALNEVFLKAPQKALKTICHELAHIATYEYCKQNNYKPEQHSSTWRNNYQKIGQYFGMKYSDFTRCNSAESLGLNKMELDGGKMYKVYCNCCKKEYIISKIIYNKMVRGQYRTCCKCHNRVTLEKEF